MTDKQIIIDGVDVSGCYCYVSTSKEYSCGLTCSKFHYRFCKENPNCHYKKWQRKEQECEDFKQKLLDKTYAYSVMERSRRNSLQQLDQLEEENISLKKQLQFEFDETLLQYSNTIEDLQKQLNNTVMQKCPQCGEVYLNPIGCELHEENQQLKAENKTQKETIDGFLTILDKLGKSNIKLRETLTEIKEIGETCSFTDDSELLLSRIEHILQKISESEVE